MTSSSRKQPPSSALYTQFCIGVELGDETLVRDLVVRGADTMVSYGVDGVVTTPMQSALTKGDVPMALALLTSRSTRVRLADIDRAPRVKKELVTPVFMRRMSDALEDGAREALLQRDLPVRRGAPVKVSLSESIADHLRASATDRVRCPPKELLPPEEEEEDPLTEDEPEEETTSDSAGEEAEEEEAGSFASSAEDSSVDGDA